MSSPSSSRPDLLREKKLDHLLAERLEQLPKGCAVAAVIFSDQGYEFRMFGEGAARNVIFEIGSVTKVFTALLLADMVVRQEVRLDQPVRELLPAEFQPKPSGAEITLGDLAIHHSGLPRLPRNLAPFWGTLPARHADNPYAYYGPDKLAKFLKRQGLERPQEPEYLYSNVGFGLLGMALANRLGTSYDEAIQQRICTPLGMTDTRVELTYEQRHRALPGHTPLGKPATVWHFATLEGAGALHSTLNDMLRFLKAQLFPEGDLEAALRLTHERKTEPKNGVPALAMGWHIHPDNSYWHNGATGGFSSYVAFNDVYRRSVAVLCNAARSDISDIVGVVLGQPPV